ncbi:SHOCT domain-containing protein, partial [Weissella paramesenteroides]
MDNNEKINELKELLAEGILTQEEFDNEMAKLNGDTPKEEYTEKVNADIG